MLVRNGFILLKLNFLLMLRVFFLVCIDVLVGDVVIESFLS